MSEEIDFLLREYKELRELEKAILDRILEISKRNKVNVVIEK